MSIKHDVVNIGDYLDDPNSDDAYTAFSSINEAFKSVVPETGLPITDGGTGATTLEVAKQNLEIDQVNNTPDAQKPISAATQQALDSKADKTATQLALNDKVNKADVIAIAKGGTGATTAEQARINLGLTPIRLPAGTDLNNVKTPGTYYCDANVDVATMSNNPMSVAFTLKVDLTAGCIQEFTTYADEGSRRFIRGFYGSNWIQWEEVVKGANAAASRAKLELGSAATRNVGMGLGDLFTVESSRRAFGKLNIRAALPANWDMNFISEGDYVFYSGDVSMWNPPPVAYGSFYGFRNLNNAEQLTVLGHDYFTGGIITRGKQNGVWSGWAKHYHTLNTTINGNGYIVPSSPTVKIHPDSFELNEDSIKLGAVCEKLGVGHYEISNVDGFHQEGWYFDIPTDRYKNPLIAADYEYLPDERKIVIKAYAVKANTFPFEPDLDTPMDAPQGRWIDVRLYEPEWLNRTELPKPEEPLVDIEGNPAPSRLHELVDGVWVISDESAAILEQERLAAMPALKRRQFRLTLAMNGYDLKEIEALIDQIEDPMQRTITQIEWQDATDFERTNPTLLMMAQLLGLSSEDVDSLWEYGLAL